MAETKQEELKAPADFRPKELEGMEVTYRGGGNRQVEAVFTKDGIRWGTIAGELTEQNLTDMAQRSMEKYLNYKRAQREKAAREA